MKESVKLKCGVIDDEPLARELIRSYVAKTPGLELDGEFESASEAAPEVIKGRFDLLFLDINMPGINGIEFGSMVPDSTRIIYITAYEQYALDGYRVNALDYLLKPVSYTEFAKAAGKAMEWKLMKESYTRRDRTAADESKRLTSISVRSDYRLLQLRLDSILYVEVKGDRVIFYRDDGEAVSSLMSMREIEEILPGDRFMRIHRSYIVNLDRVEIVERSRVVFGRTYIPVSDSHREEFLRRLSRR